jgi:hypothetical protein
MGVMSEEADRNFTVEEVDSVEMPARARVEDLPEESASVTLVLLIYYVEGYLAQEPAAASPAEHGGDLYVGRSAVRRGGKACNGMCR